MLQPLISSTKNTWTSQPLQKLTMVLFYLFIFSLYFYSKNKCYYLYRNCIFMYLTPQAIMFSCLLSQIWFINHGFIVIKLLNFLLRDFWMLETIKSIHGFIVIKLLNFLLRDFWMLETINQSDNCINTIIAIGNCLELQLQFVNNTI